MENRGLAMKVSPCPNCESAEQYQSKKTVSAGGGYAPNYLPDLGRWHTAAKFTVVVCKRCGLTRWFATEEALQKLGESERWERV
jgi:predicted nucleic-acid-binding Zn-ribbon protein